jgi:hypothetical protein
VPNSGASGPSPGARAPNHLCTSHDYDDRQEPDTVKSQGQTALSDIDVVRLSRTDWRVSHSGAPERVLGYVERQRANRFEIVWMTDPMRWGYTTTFDDALMAFGDASRFTGEILDERASESLALVPWWARSRPPRPRKAVALPPRPRTSLDR